MIPTSEIIIRDNDNFEVALKRFGRMVQQSGILSEARRRAHFESPSETRKRKAAAKVRKLNKQKLKEKRYNQ